jgi:hypothetical protein
MRIPRGAGTQDATVATTSRTNAVTPNVHGSSGSTRVRVDANHAVDVAPGRGRGSNNGMDFA